MCNKNSKRSNRKERYTNTSSHRNTSSHNNYSKNVTETTTSRTETIGTLAGTKTGVENNVPRTYNVVLTKYHSEDTITTTSELIVTISVKGEKDTYKYINHPNQRDHNQKNIHTYNYNYTIKRQEIRK